MNGILADLTLAVIGLSGGIAVGSGLIAFILVLDIIPRLAQLTRTFSEIYLYEGAMVAGTLFWTLADFNGWKSELPLYLLVIVGLFCGVFVGMLAAALTEVVNVIPILAKRLRMEQYIAWLLLAMVTGKVVGSLLEFLWLFP
ncbi:stage V sporulation protein AB [Gorillibacterium massiliense]|uniref:stage V sporulation protein AB n=1 Tax=Gorillibacterium massiliense TaxID=1280390 RepID=UPI0004B5EF8E|nr:stage V sporulation protein AB [Gorillibacterium massiliense]